MTREDVLFGIGEGLKDFTRAFSIAQRNRLIAERDIARRREREEARKIREEDAEMRRKEAEEQRQAVTRRVETGSALQLLNSEIGAGNTDPTTLRQVLDNTFPSHAIRDEDIERRVRLDRLQREKQERKLEKEAIEDAKKERLAIEKEERREAIRLLKERDAGIQGVKEQRGFETNEEALMAIETEHPGFVEQYNILAEKAGRAFTFDVKAAKPSKTEKVFREFANKIPVLRGLVDEPRVRVELRKVLNKVDIDTDLDEFIVKE